MTNRFISSFWYADALGLLATLNHTGFCRQTLIGGNYGLLNRTTAHPNPDFFIAQLFHDLMGERVLSFTSHDLPIDLPAIEQFRDRGDAEREYILPELLRVGWSDEQPDDKRDASQASFNFRLVEVVMMALLPLLAVALGVPPKRSTSALGVFLSIIMVVAYHKVNQYGEDIAALGRLDPFLALWGPFLLFAALIGWMYWRVAHVPGGQAIGALEIWFDKVAKRIGRLFRRRRLKIDLAAAE